MACRDRRTDENARPPRRSPLLLRSRKKARACGVAT